MTADKLPRTESFHDVPIMFTIAILTSLRRQQRIELSATSYRECDEKLDGRRRRKSCSDPLGGDFISPFIPALFT